MKNTTKKTLNNKLTFNTHLNTLFHNPNSSFSLYKQTKRHYKEYFKQVVPSSLYKEKLQTGEAKLPVKPKLASTVIICRPIPPQQSIYVSNVTVDYEILLVKRRKEARFMPNFYVFPGGLLEEESDFLPPSSPLFHNLSEELKENELKRGLRFAAIREVFEESNIFLSAKDYPPPSPSLLSNWKQRVLSNPKEFKAMCESLKAKVSMDGLFEWAHWITPEFEKYRYDTYFYVIPVDYSSSLNSSDDQKEVVAHEWIRPDVAIDRFQKGEIKLAPPTWITIAELDNNFPTLSNLLQAAETGRDMTAILPEFDVERFAPDDDEKKSIINLYLPGDSKSKTPISNDASRRIQIDVSQVSPYSFINEHLPKDRNAPYDFLLKK